MKDIQQLLQEYEGKVSEAIQQNKIYCRERTEFDEFTVAVTDDLETKGIDSVEALNIFLVQFDNYLQDFIMQKIRSKRLNKRVSF